MPSTETHQPIPADTIALIEQLAGTNKARLVHLTELAQKLADEGLL